ncbi:MAG: hypothetical protein ACYCT3_03385 [Acidiferrobacter sp.]
MTSWAAMCAAAGAVIGFLLRPSDLFGHQLPLSTVLSRGADLQGINQLLVPLAERSFNDAVAGLMIGALVGALIGALSGRR